MEVVEEDVDDILNDIMVSPVKKYKKIVRGKKIPSDVPLVPMDKVSFHYEESVLKWKYVYHKIISRERELSE